MRPSRAAAGRILLHLALFGVLLAPLLCFYLGALWNCGGRPGAAESWPNATQWRALGNSLGLATATTLLSLAFGLPVAVALSGLERGWRHGLTSLCLLPLLIPPYLSASAWVAATAWRGPLHGLPLFNFGGCVWILSLSLWPVIALLGSAALRRVDRRQEEAARLTAAPAAVWRRITLPLAWPTLAAGCGIVFLLALADYGVADLLLLRTFTTEALVSFRWGPDMPEAARVTLPLVLCVAAVVAFVGVYPSRRSFLSVGGSADLSGRPVSRPARAWLGSGTGLLLALSAGFPVAAFVAVSASRDAYREAFQIGAGLIANSLGTAALGASATLLFCLPFARRTQSGSRGERAYVELVALLAFALPATIVGVGLAALYNRPGPLGWVYRSLWILVLGYVARFFFIAWKAVSAVQAGVDPALLEAARVCGASPWGAYRRVFLPLARGSLGALWLVLFVLCFGELGLTVLLSPPGWRTLPVTLFGLMHFGYDGLVMALCLIFFAAVLVPAAAAMYVWRRYGDARFL